MSKQEVVARVAVLLETSTVPELGPGRRPDAWPVAKVNDQVEAVTGGLSAHKPLIQALALLWHDHLELSHAISQGIANSDGSYLHGLMHRREPDYDNAKYWFRRVGYHPAFRPLAVRVKEIVSGAPWAEHFVVANRWDPMAFIDSCATVAAKPHSSEKADLLRAIQATEMRVLLEEFCRL